jgi:hypothetical protein
MVTRIDILRQAERKYPAWLRAQVTGASFFPIAITLKKNHRAESYDARREQLAALRAAEMEMGFRIVWMPVNDMRFGPHERPESAAWHCEDAWLHAIEKTREAAAFRADLALIRASGFVPEIWLEPNVRKIVENHGQWAELLRVVEWMTAHPRCGLYLRQLPIPGVHTKFVEQNMRLLDDLLQHAAPQHITPDATTFAGRHGLREEESVVRLRFLDDSLRVHCALPGFAHDLALPLSALAALPLERCGVIITENLRNFLVLPELPGTIALHGHGDAIVRLRRAGWLASCRVYYWGDLDLHGFAIFARLRMFLPHAAGLLMTAADFTRHRHLAVPDETLPPSISMEFLDQASQELCEQLRDPRLRLEQERIPMEFLLEALSEAGLMRLH